MKHSSRITYQSKLARILFHIPRLWEGYEEALLGEIEALDQALRSFPEWIDSNIDKHYGKISLNTSPYFIENGLFLIDGDFYFSIPKYKMPRSVSFSAFIHRPAIYTSPLRGPDRWLGLFIPKDVVQLLGCDWLRDQMIRIRRNLRATYAHMDMDPFCRDLFEFWAKSDPPMEFERCVPGFHWLQFLSDDMIAQTGTAQEVAQNAPCAWAAVDDQGPVHGVWLQMTDNLWGNPLKARYTYREYFARSLWELDWDRIKEFMTPLFHVGRKIEIAYFPWVGEEKGKIARIMEDLDSREKAWDEREIKSK